MSTAPSPISTQGSGATAHDGAPSADAAAGQRPSTRLAMPETSRTRPSTAPASQPATEPPTCHAGRRGVPADLPAEETHHRVGPRVRVVELQHAAHHEPVVTDVVDLLDLAVDPGADPRQDRAARGRGGDPVDPLEAVVGLLGEPPAQLHLVVGEHVHAEGPARPDLLPAVRSERRENPARGGSSDTDVNEPMVRPDGLGGRAEPGGGGTSPVTTVTPGGSDPAPAGSGAHRRVRGHTFATAGAAGRLRWWSGRRAVDCLAGPS